MGCIASFRSLWSKIKPNCIWRRIRSWIWKWVVCVIFRDGKHPLHLKYILAFNCCLLQIFYFIFQFIVRVVPCCFNKICLMQLAADMQRFSRPERRINGPTTTHLWCVWVVFIIFQILFWTYHWILRCHWQFHHYFHLYHLRVTSCMIAPHLLTALVFPCRSMLKLLDVLVQLDHLKNAKASLSNDFSWYKRYGNN